MTQEPAVHHACIRTPLYRLAPSRGQNLLPIFAQHTTLMRIYVKYVRAAVRRCRRVFECGAICRRLCGVFFRGWNWGTSDVHCSSRLLCSAKMHTLYTSLSPSLSLSCSLSPSLYHALSPSLKPLLYVCKIDAAAVVTCGATAVTTTSVYG